MTDIQGKVFSDFEAPTTTDGSYRGQKKMIEASNSHYQMKLEQELTRINERLKAAKVRVRLLITAGSVQLQATLPLKPDDTHKQGKSSKQYKISLGIPASFDGLITAEEEAHDLGKLIARKTFTWTDKYLGVQATKNKGITFKEFYEQFEERYFETRKRTRKSEETFKNYRNLYKRYFLSKDDSIVTKESLISIISSVQLSGTRPHMIKLGNIIKKALNIDAEFTNLRLKHKKKERIIPSDKEVIQHLNSFQLRYESSSSIPKESKNRWKIYKLIYGLLAIYGLRPREVINKPDLDWLISSDNTHNTFKVNEDNKTGYREAIPFVPEWVDLFDIKNKESIELLKKDIKKYTPTTNLEVKVECIARNFNKSGIPFKPYDLRHACAIRAHLQGVPIKAAADNLGHSVEMHTEVYQHWFGFDNRVKAFNQAFEEQNEIEKLKDELTWYKKRVSELEVENTRLKLQNKSVM